MFILGLIALTSPAAAQRIGIYPLETSDSNLSIALPTAVSRTLEAVDGAIFVMPADLFAAQKRRPSFEGKLETVFSLASFITGKLEGAAGNYTVTYTIKSGSSAAKTVTAKGADFQKLVIASNDALLAGLGLKPTATDTAEVEGIEKTLPGADVVAASVAVLEDGSAAILERAGQQPWALYTRALLLMQQSKDAEALPLAVSAARLAPQDPGAMATLALAQLSNRNNAEAKTAIDAALKLNPAKPEVHYLQGRYILRATTPVNATVIRNALSSLERAMQYNPRFLEASVIAADLYQRLGNVDAAYNALVNLVPRMPDEPALHNRILDLLLDADRDQATTYLRQVITQFPDVPDTVYALASRLVDTTTATRLIADGEKRYATSPALAHARGNLLERQTKYADAVTAYKQALERDPKLQRAGLALAGALSKLGRFDEAEGAIQAAFGRVDQKLLARMYLQTGRFDRAKAVLDKLPATDVDVPYYQGVLLMRQYQPAEARKQLEAALKIKADDSRVKETLPELPDAERLGTPKLTGDALYQLQLAQSLLDARNTLEAANVLQNALKANPNDVHLNFYYGYALYFIADPDDAVDQFDAALKLAPNNVVVMTWLALSYINNGRLDLALDTANKAIARDNKYARAHMILGFANIALGNVAPARAALLKAIEVNKDFEVIVTPYLNALPR
jgi:tetratricopeptide (TPR) repeat protein